MKVYATFAMTAAATSSCTVDVQDAQKDEASIGRRGAREPPVSWEEFLASVYKEPWEGGMYLVDGDLPLSNVAEVREYYDSWFDEDFALTVDRVSGVDNLWSYPTQFQLTYCVSQTFGANYQTVVTNMVSATASWSALLGVSYAHIVAQDGNCNQSNNNVMFDVRPVSNDGILASAFFPDDTRTSRSLRIRPAAFTDTAGGVDFQGILRHELGHTIGFRHEHIWLTNPCTDEGTADARLVNSYDVNSVMHYPWCRPSGTGGLRQTQLDYEGGIALYGLAPALISEILD